ncbi:hypothetical protein BM525_18980 (plasmid) [Alteromonas mediterranea]|uniref:Uncharacterized protein n=1 Tax=Alteromonas mediterranea TaxID=314275 RepID=A0AAC9NTC5_9ALTE|nr:hypothetical protein [Alteromonas mediterranea]APD91968.1 hypothetical protein BM524_18785 [Alteromonas mediterranea]APD99822.1 hypothetical protein BM525_18980 [Alteromonas mediterranea]
MTTVNLSKSQIETIVLEAIQEGATALAEHLDAENVAKEVQAMVRERGEELIQSISSSAMKRYSQK